jgi:hypothetical protein
MHGTEKQIIWAEEIKAASVDAWQEIAAANHAQTLKSQARAASRPDSQRADDNAAADAEADAGFVALVATALNVTDAVEWIDGRAFGNIANPQRVGYRVNRAHHMREIVEQMVSDYRNAK